MTSRPAEPGVALLGGTFDPVHYGHLFAAQAARDALSLEQVVFVPARVSPHKEGRAVAEPAHRLAMVRLAVAGNPGLAVSEVELGREGPSYTVDTVATLRAAGIARVSLVLGTDAFLLIRTWKRWEDLLGQVGLVLVSRPGSSDRDARALAEELGAPVDHWVEALGVAVSSSELRGRLARGRTVRYLVPDPVLEYIAEHSLYRSYA
jgi:nicotinate-nucleotide adenylyltransferase